MSSLPSSWFRNFEAACKWLDTFSSRKLCLCDSVDHAFLESLLLPCIILLKGTSLWPILNPGEVHYPRLTRLFFVNLTFKRDRENLTLNTTVCNTKIELTPRVIADIFGLPKDISTDGHPPRADCFSLAKGKFFLPALSSVSPCQLTHNVLNLEAKIIFTTLARCIIPRSHSRELVTDQLLSLLYLVMSGYEIDVPNLILNHMVHSISSARDIPLPYGNLLPHIFKHFHLDTSLEEKAIHPGKVDMNCFQRIGIIKVADGSWKLKGDLTPEEIAATPGLRLKSAPSSSMPEERLEELELGLDALRRDVIDFQFEMSYKLDQTHELLAMVNAKINNMFHLNALTFTYAGNILPLADDVAEHCKAKAANVIFNCEQSVRNRKILRPVVPEPSIITVEVYDVIKRYRREVEQQRRVDEMVKDQKVNQAHRRWKRKAEKDMDAKKHEKDGEDSGYGKWHNE